MRAARSIVSSSSESNALGRQIRMDSRRAAVSPVAQSSRARSGWAFSRFASARSAPRFTPWSSPCASFTLRALGSSNAANSASTSPGVVPVIPGGKHVPARDGGRTGTLGVMSAPLNLVNLERVHKAHGATVILDDVSLGVAAGERIGVVGRNGGGKSTLLSLLTGADEPDSGRVTRRSDLALGVLDQSGTLPAGTTVRDVVLPPSMFAAEHEWAGDPAVRSVLTGLELDRMGLDAPVAPMSGGERRRVALAAQLIRPLDLLVLDEPTNHLDVEGVAWLAEYVRARAGGLVVVTHDRWFLDEVCTTTWEVADGAVHSYDGGYSAYTLARAERARISAVTEERRLNLVRKELAWLRRGPPARTSKPKFRIEAAQALIADEPPARDSMELAGFAARRLGRTVYDVEDVTHAVRGAELVSDDDDPAGPADPQAAGERTLFRDLTWRVGP